MSLWEYVSSRRDLILFEAAQHASMVAQCVLVAAVLGVLVGVLSYRRARVSALALGMAGVLFTIPSLAMLGLLIPPLGLGVAPSVTAIGDLGRGPLASALGVSRSVESLSGR